MPQTWEAAEEIQRACQQARVQFMDGTMWVHSPRAAEMARVIKAELGQLKSVISAFAFRGAPRRLMLCLALFCTLWLLGKPLA